MTEKSQIQTVHSINRLHAGRDALQTLWEQGLKGRELLIKHTKIVDRFISDAFSACREPKEEMALVAVGGYGRAELFPFSDIDVMLLYAPEVEAQVPAVVESVFYPLWDAGLEVGHSVRTVEACLADAQDDFLFHVSLVDARFICGDESLFLLLRDEFSKSLSEDRKTSFVKNMISHRDERQTRFGSHSYLLEPNIKESRGGLRDIHAVLWTSKVLFGLGDARSLEKAGIITAKERAAMEEAWDFLLQIRNRLHYVKSSKNDRLFFEYQEEIARFFEYRDCNGMLAVEDFMRRLHRYLQTLAVISDLFFEYVEELLHISGCNTENSLLEPGIGIINCHICLTDPHVIKKKPGLLMRIFVQAGRTGLPIYYQTRRIISSNLDLIDDRLRSSRQMAGAFMEVLRGAKRPLEVLEAMLDTGFLTAYIPEFSGIRFLAQHDVYHIYTVDRHLVQTVAELHKLEKKEHQVFKALKSRHILYLAALLHDIGKGHGGHHAERGAEIVRGIGERMGLSPEENACLSFLVHNHL
ncbi:MAG: HD domain-containing protein, partial [Nitrospiraceae bacterium]|nr:HD domain-containing protein [Nitrospiraceae bacterium]